MGQDPYPGMNKVKGKMIPQATGISFSVPFNFPKPESLINIYHNLLNFGHIKKIPKSGNLIYWILQGCFMVNASLTTFLREKNVHRCIWRHFTDDLLDYLNKKLKNLVFMVWGKDAHVLCQKIDPKKHYIITSSHPSPLSYGKTFIGSSYGNHNDAKKIVYPSFKNTDHFGKANKYLEIVGQKGIFWDVID
jgi:uracil-DNA glycosylase